MGSLETLGWAAAATTVRSRSRTTGTVWGFSKTSSIVSKNLRELDWWMNTCDELRSIIAQSYQANAPLRSSKCGEWCGATYTSGGQLSRGLRVSANSSDESTMVRGSCEGATDLNSRLRALTASLALDSLEDARSQTSRTRAQSSEAVAVR